MSALVEGAAATATGSRTRRMAEGALFVGVWIALGYALRLPADPYLLLGVPLTVVFQLLVRRRPIRAAWVREAPSWRISWQGWVVAAVLAVLPAYFLVTRALSGEWEWVSGAWMTCALAGAVVAGYAVTHLRREESRQGLRWLASAVIAGTLIMLVSTLPGLLALDGPPPVTDMLLAAVQALLLYTAVTFVLEEVAFRGVLDAHLAEPGESGQWATAIYSSALWGLWHLPISPPGQPLWQSVVSALLVHLAVGIPLAFTWRKTGNLTYAAVGHAVVDAIRNGLTAGL
jgi:Type II CAAX prenyl endopeptidase Rce1-like